ncbi:heme/hemin ABC transporter substrate-binding protein [Ketogulonicigenium vulgare]|uniref:heme/hemin ABC transporter substrate-binding protein n=1 Tax=Ketogulonicigenium vulgare TaxID=92945 RepID=UPI0023583102|nr:ABC transporter substrate-binding protein [Ketogulonicigenium vulgare]
MRRLLLTSAIAIAVATGAQAQDRILSLGSSVTEILFAIGAEDKVIARDLTSTYPAAAEALPDVGYVRALSPEGVLSVNADMIIAEPDAGPVETIDVLKAASIPWVTVPAGWDAAQIVEKINLIGEATGHAAEAAALAATVTAELETAATAAAEIPEDQRKRVLFIISTNGGRVMAAGSETGGNAIIELAGAVNAVQGVEGYKPLTDEAITAAAPDVILMMDRGHNLDAANDELWAMPVLASTPAGQNQAVIRMDGIYLLGFGPRTGAATLELHHALYAGN